MRFVLACLTGVAVWCLAPTDAWAQATYRTLTLIDAQYLWTGLGVQTLLRQSPTLRFMPQVVLYCSILWLLYRRVVTRMPLTMAGIIVYAVGATVIMALFWPEGLAGGFTPAGVVKVVQADDVLSVVADRHGMTRKTAADVSTPGSLGSEARVPVFFDAVLKAITETPLRLGEVISSKFTEPMSHLVGTASLLFMPLDARLQADLSAWGTACYFPALERLQNNSSGSLEEKDIYPWAAPLQGQLSGELTRELRNQWVSDDYGTAGGFSSPTAEVESCASFYTNTAAQVDTWVSTLNTAQGSDFRSEIRDMSGMSDLSVRRFFIWRHLESVVPPAVESDNKRDVAVAWGVGKMVSAALGWARRLVGTAAPKGPQPRPQQVSGPPKSPLANIVPTGIISTAFDKLANFVRAPMAFLMFLPYVTGIVSAVVVGLFPVAVIWSLFPGQGFRTLINYFLVLFFVQSSPLWWAISDACSRLAFRVYGGGPNVLESVSITAWTQGQAAAVIVAVCCVVIVPAIEAALLFGSWKTVSSAFAHSGATG